MHIGVVGAGAMGRGIAQVSATAGHEVRIFDVVPGAAAAACEVIAGSLDRAITAGRISPEDARATLQRIVPVDSLTAFAAAELVIEAIIEDLDVKRSTFAGIEQIVGPDCLLASNTSSLAIGAIATQMEDPGRLIGLHFFNPVPAMRLVEIVTRPQTDPAVTDRARGYVESLGKTGIEVLDSPGFLVNLAGRALNTEALAMLRDNIATVSQIDQIAREVLGFRLGPFELMDLTGMDVNYPVTDNLFQHHFADPLLRSTWQHRYLYEVGHLGRKTGVGFYSYDDGADPGSRPPVQQEVHAGDGLSIDDAGPSELHLSQPRYAICGSERLADIVRAAGIDAVNAVPAGTGVGRAGADSDLGVERGSGSPGAGAGADVLTIVDPMGEDLLTHCQSQGVNYPHVIGIDTFFADPAVLTVMVPPGAAEASVASVVRALERVAPVVVINESPGFVAQRLLAAVVNLACEIAQYGIAAPADIDTAVELGLRYPHGPLSWADRVGAVGILEILDGMHASTRDARYTASAWLRRRALAGISCLTDDHLPAIGRHTVMRHGT